MTRLKTKSLVNELKISKEVTRLIMWEPNAQWLSYFFENCIILVKATTYSYAHVHDGVIACRRSVV